MSRELAAARSLQQNGSMIGTAPSGGEAAGRVDPHDDCKWQMRTLHLVEPKPYDIKQSDHGSRFPPLCADGCEDGTCEESAFPATLAT